MKYKVGDKVMGMNNKILTIVSTNGIDYIMNNGQNYCEEMLEKVEEFSSIKELIKLEEKELNNQYRYGEFDDIQKAEHYNKGIETIDYIESHNLNFNLGNAIKYITRCEHKGDKLNDLRKAKWYIEREIERESGQSENTTRQRL